MKTIGLFYAMNAAKTSHIAEKIREDLGGVKVIEVVLIEKAWQNDFQAYDNMIWERQLGLMVNFLLIGTNWFPNWSRWI